MSCPVSPGAHLYDPASLSCTLWMTRQLVDILGELSDMMDTPDLGVTMRSLCSHCVIFWGEGGLVTTQVRFRTCHCPTWGNSYRIIYQVKQWHTLTRRWWPTRIFTEVSENLNLINLCKLFSWSVDKLQVMQTIFSTDHFIAVTQPDLVQCVQNNRNKTLPTCIIQRCIIDKLAVIRL